MRWSWKIAEVAGIGIYIHASFWLLILFVLFSGWLRGHTLARLVTAAVFVLVIFGCIILHELGHALTARRFGIRTREITLLPIGGVARLDRMPDDPRQELWVALAGPAVNFAIAGLIFVGTSALNLKLDWREIRWTGGTFLNELMAANVWLGLFNLLPAFPMDGGRVLRALLARRMEYTSATLVAARVGYAMAFLFGLVGLFANPFLIFIALFVWMGAEQEATMVQARSSLGGLPVQRVMLTDFRTLSADDTLAKAVEHILAGWQHDFPVTFGDRVLGVLTREGLIHGLTRGGTESRVRDAMQRDVPEVDSHDMLEPSLAVLKNAKCRSLPVLHAGRLVGMLNMENIGEFLMIQAALRRLRHESVQSTLSGQHT